MELLNDIRDLPSGLSSLELYHDAACSWVRRQSEIWSRWISVDTNCFLGYGLVDEHGAFLSSMAGGVSCEVCPAGTFSENFADDSGRTRRCTPCPAGTSQAKAASSHCEACRPGRQALLLLQRVASRACRARKGLIKMQLVRQSEMQQ